MSDETTVVEKTDVVVTNPHEETARSQGWVPKDEWVKQGGPEENWRTAKEFVERGELYKSLHSTRRDLKQTQAALTALQRHHQYVFERAHAKALDDLKREKRAAIKNEDFEHLEFVEEQIENLEKAHTEEKANMVAEQRSAEASAPHPEFVAWQDKNQWYVQDNDLREFADAQGMIFMNKNPGVSPNMVLKHVEEQVKKFFPDKLGGRKAAPNAVAGVNRSGKTTSKADDLELDEMERSIMRTFVDTGVMTEAEYKQELRKARGGK